MNPEGMFKGGSRQRDLSPKDSLALSGRLIPEFNQRRSIKAMFGRTNSTNGSNTPTLPTISSSISSSAEEAGNKLSEMANTDNMTKRPQSANASRSPVKKFKTNAGAGKGGSQRGQQSLKGFFKPQAEPAISSSAPINETAIIESPHNTLFQEISTPETPTDAEKTTPTTGDDNTPLGSPSHQTKSASMTVKDEYIIDPIVSKESWSKLFTKKVDPKCEGHEEPCLMLTTKKPGLNRGRAFWICSRPLGPSGTKEKGTQWRCGTFIWASDWNSPS
jgi:AP endonuclease-2